MATYTCIYPSLESINIYCYDCFSLTIYLLTYLLTCRAHMAVNSVKSRALHRTILMYGFHCLVYIFCTRHVRDTQCGFKLFRRVAAQRIFSGLHLERWAFDIELIYLAEAHKITIVEVSELFTITWYLFICLYTSSLCLGTYLYISTLFNPLSMSMSMLISVGNCSLERNCRIEIDSLTNRYCDYLTIYGEGYCLCSALLFTWYLEIE